VEVIAYRGRLYELSVIGDIVNDRLELECWDLSAEGGGLLFTLWRDENASLILEPSRSPIPLDLLERVAIIAGTELTE
jgi:hypothetical protein